MEHRLQVAFAVLVIGLLVLLVRTGYMQVFSAEKIALRAHDQHFDLVELDATRGRVYDRHGRILAGSYYGITVAADPQRVEDADLFATRLAFLMGEIDAAPGFAKRIRSRRAAGSRYVVLHRGLDRDAAERLAAARLVGIDLREEARRVYPHENAAIQLLGLFGGAGDPKQRMGLGGLEAQFDSRLRGSDGSRNALMLLHRVDGRVKREEHLLYPERCRPALSGLDLHTTIDVALQQIAEEALDEMQERHSPKRSCAIAMDPRTGEILAMASRPTFKLADWPGVDRESLKVQAIEWCYEPGSTIKPLILAAALSEGVVRPGQQIDCGTSGRHRFGRRLLHDVHAYGVLELADLLVKSSNIGMGQVAQAMGSARLHSWLLAYGFGSRIGLPLSGESAGTVLKLERWKTNYEDVSVGIGYGVAVTPVQLLSAYAAVITDGVLRKPRLLRDADCAVEHRPGRALDLSRVERDFVRRAMGRVVAEGSDTLARIPDWPVGGKTGTSKKYPLHLKRYVASFVGFAPVEDPQILVLVAADEPTRKDGGVPYGRVVAMRAAGRFLRRARPLLESEHEEALSRSGVRHVTNPAELVRVAAVK